MIERLGATECRSSSRRENKKPKSYRPKNEFRPKLTGMLRMARNGAKFDRGGMEGITIPVYIGMRYFGHSGRNGMESTTLLLIDECQVVQVIDIE